LGHAEGNGTVVADRYDCLFEARTLVPIEVVEASFDT
jgi:hypothetical protein